VKTIGNFEIRGLLGRGGMAKVYKVRIPTIGKIAALKALYPNPHLLDLMGEERIRNLFVTEAATLAKLRHPGIVEIWNFGETGEGMLHYLMDYYFNNVGMMIGETYRPDAPSRIISLDKAIDYTSQILDGLACLHYHGIVHRDIKPFNILLTAYDTVKICDFGLSKLRGESFKGPENLKVGSPYYTAPEQADDPDRAEAAADIYSVGVLLYRMLTGALPADHPERPSRFNADLDWRWDGFLLKSIAPNPRQRFATPAAMSADLDRLARNWRQQKEKVCRVYPVKSDSGKRAERVRHRHFPIKVRPKAAVEVFGLDELWRPEVWVENAFRDNGDGTVTDDATNLVWQQSGTPYPLTWHDAHDYIDILNRRRFAGRSDWRLPTVDELMSLLVDTPHGEDHCIESVFDPLQKQLWSSDRRSFIAAWFVSAEMGFVWWQDFSAFYYARAVCEAVV
jgi:serine/threonine-protein kinase